MTRHDAPPASVDGLLAVNRTCERAIMLATPQQVRAGTPMSCGRTDCAGLTGTPRRRGRWVTVAAPAPGGCGTEAAPGGCGTEAGYRRHARAGQPPCPACRAANTQAASRRKAAKG